MTQDMLPQKVFIESIQSRITKRDKNGLANNPYYVRVSC